MDLKEIASSLKGPLENLLKKIGDEAKQMVNNRILEYQVEEYRRNYFTKTLLHRAEPIPLKDFYQALFIRESRHLKKSYDGNKISTDSPSILFQKLNYITIIGSAGSGKSTIVKHLYTKCFEEGYKIPIKIELRYLNEYSGSFENYLVNEIFKFYNIGISDDVIFRLLNGDNFIFFLDGYDEISSQIKTRITNDIDRFVSKFPLNKFLITSRPYTSIDLLTSFKNFDVCDLELLEIAAFVKKQLSNQEKELGEKIIEAINKAENSSYLSFLSNPLLLSMFILTFSSYSEIPQKRSEFYSQVFDTLFSVHDSISKLAYVREKCSGLNKEQFEEILRLFSFISFFEERFLFPSHYLLNILNQIKDRKGNLIFENDKLISDLQVAIGILNKEGLDYTFPHRSLQEYFAAAYIANLSQVNKVIVYNKIKENIISAPIELFHKDHFFQLLRELDYLNLCKLVGIPLLEKIYSDLQSKRLTPTTISRAYACVGMYYFVIFDLSTLLPREAKTFMHNELGIDLSMLDLKTKSSHREDSNYYRITQEQIRKFKKDGDKIINMIKAELELIDASDQAIIGLIK